MAPKTLGSELLPVDCGTRRDGLMSEPRAGDSLIWIEQKRDLGMTSVPPEMAG
jgi:hypothetical protein